MLIPFIAFLGTIVSSAASDPRMTNEERARTINQLRDSEREFLDLIKDLNDAQWSYKPGPFRWSVGEAAEHIVLTEESLFSVVQRALQTEASAEWEQKTSGKTEFLERALPSRERRAQAPERIQPTSNLTKKQVLDRFTVLRVRTIKFAEETRLPLKTHLLEHPFPVFGTLNAYHWLIYIPLHHNRHNQQIAEIKASPGFPK